MTDITEIDREAMTFEEYVTARLDAMDAKLDRVVMFCDRAVLTAEKLSQHPMMASIFPGGIKK